MYFTFSALTEAGGEDEKMLKAEQSQLRRLGGEGSSSTETGETTTAVVEEVSSVFSVLAMEARPALRDIATRRAYVLATAVCPGAVLSVRVMDLYMYCDKGKALSYALYVLIIRANLFLTS